MEAMTLHRSLVATFGVSDVSTLKKPQSLQIGAWFVFSKGLSKRYPSVSPLKLGSKEMSLRPQRGMVVQSSLSSDAERSSGSIAPLLLESPVGQFLSQILVSHPHLVFAAVEEQLEQLQTDRDGDKNEDSSVSGMDLVLYRRIAEVKANERKKALEEILYALVVKKFMDSSVPLISTINPDAFGRVNSWPSHDKKLEKLHSPEAYDMVQNHIALILGNGTGDSTSIAQISKIRVGQVYAASVMYGYFLRQIDQRFQLEKTVKTLPNISGEEKGNIQQSVREETRPSGGDESICTVQSHPEGSSWAGGMSPGGFGSAIKNCRLRTYVMSFDGETLQRYATIRSKEAVGIIEKHTEALFGKPDIVITPQGTIDSSNDELFK